MISFDLMYQKQLILIIITELFIKKMIRVKCYQFYEGYIFIHLISFTVSLKSVWQDFQVLS